jgi:hypothetical protein
LNNHIIVDCNAVSDQRREKYARNEWRQLVHWSSV